MLAGSPKTGPPCAVVLNSRWHPRSTGRQPPRSHTIWPDGLPALACAGGRSRTTRAGRSSRPRLADGGSRGLRFSHSLSSLRNEPAPQVILTQRSPSALEPYSQISGQTRAGLDLIASSASRLASFTSSPVPAFLLNSSSERRDALFHSPSTDPVRQPTRRNSVCTDFTSSVADGGDGEAAAGSADGEWNKASRRSLELFNKNAGTRLDVKLASLDALDAIKSRTARVCPLICETGFRADRERCVKITCAAGSFLNDDNECEKRRERTPSARRERDERPARVVRERPQGEASAAKSSGQLVCDRGGCRPISRGCHLEFRTTAQGGPVEGGGGNVQICN